MSFDKLDPEIWSHILRYLPPALPKALSGQTKESEEAIYVPFDVIDRLPSDGSPGVTSRSDIRSDTLAKLMRTSVAFNQLSSGPLYHTILTDSLPALFLGTGTSSAHPQIQSKSKLLSHTVNLHLEYTKKGDEPTYLALLEDSLFWEFMGKQRNDLPLGQAILEVGGTYKSLKSLSETLADGDKAVFPKLTRVTVGAIFGGQEEMWDVVAPAVSGFTGAGKAAWFGESLIRERLKACHDFLVNMYRQSPDLRFYCQRGQAGPLSLPPGFDWASNPSPPPSSSPPSSPIPKFTTHFNTNNDTNRIPAPIGHPVDWVLDHPGLTGEHFEQLSCTLSESLDVIRAGRPDIWKATPIDYAPITMPSIPGYTFHDIRPDVWNPHSHFDDPARPVLDITYYGDTTGARSPDPPGRLAKKPDSRFGSAFERSFMAEMNWILNENMQEALKVGMPVERVVLLPSSRSPVCRACGWSVEEA